MIIENSGTTNDKLIEIKSALFKKAEIHKTTVDENGRCTMEKSVADNIADFGSASDKSIDDIGHKEINS